MSEPDRPFVRTYRADAGEHEFVDSMVQQQEDDNFPDTDILPLEQLPTTEFQDSVVAEDVDFETMSAELQHDFEQSAFASNLRDELAAKPIVEDKFFKEEWNGIDPLAEARRGMHAEEIELGETSFSRFFEE